MMQNQQQLMQQSMMMKEMKEKRQSNQKMPLINKLAPRKDTSLFEGGVNRLVLAGSSSKRSQQNSFISNSNKSNVNL